MSKIAQNFKTKAKRGLSCASPANMASGGIIDKLVSGAKDVLSSVTAPATTVARPAAPPTSTPSPDILPDDGLVGQASRSIRGRRQALDDAERSATGLADGGVVGAKTFEFEGKGTGTSDDIPVKVAGNQINVSDGEKAVVLPAKTAQNPQALDAIETIIQQSNNGRPPHRGLRDGGQYVNGEVPTSAAAASLTNDQLRAKLADPVQGNAIRNTMAEHANAARGVAQPVAAPAAPAGAAPAGAAPAGMVPPLEMPATPAAPAEQSMLRRGISSVGRGVDWAASKVGYAPTNPTGAAPVAEPVATKPAGPLAPPEKVLMANQAMKSVHLGGALPGVPEYAPTSYAAQEVNKLAKGAPAAMRLAGVVGTGADIYHRAGVVGDVNRNAKATDLDVATSIAEQGSDMAGGLAGAGMGAAGALTYGAPLIAASGPLAPVTGTVLAAGGGLMGYYGGSKITEGARKLGRWATGGDTADVSDTMGVQGQQAQVQPAQVPGTPAQAQPMSLPAPTQAYPMSVPGGPVAPEAAPTRRGLDPAKMLDDSSYVIPSGTGAIRSSNGKALLIDSRPEMEAKAAAAKAAEPDMTTSQGVLKRAETLLASGNADQRVMGAKLMRHAYPQMLAAETNRYSTDKTFEGQRLTAAAQQGLVGVEQARKDDANRREEAAAYRKSLEPQFMRAGKDGKQEVDQTALGEFERLAASTIAARHGEAQGADKKRWSSNFDGKARSVAELDEADKSALMKNFRMRALHMAGAGGLPWDNTRGDSTDLMDWTPVVKGDQVEFPRLTARNKDGKVVGGNVKNYKYGQPIGYFDTTMGKTPTNEFLPTKAQ